MAKPRRKWEPVYRFGGNPASPYMPAPLGEFRYPSKIKPKKRKR